MLLSLLDIGECPPQNNDLLSYEADLYNMARLVKFRRVNEPFQEKPAKDAKTINTSTALYVSADKTTKVEVKNYEKLLQDCITTKYRKTNNNTTRNINLDAKQLAQKLKLGDRIEQLPENQAFITIKDHKLYFPNNIKRRLINPAKSNLGKISKQILQKINKVLRQSTDLQQWQNTPAVIT